MKQIIRVLCEDPDGVLAFCVDFKGDSAMNSLEQAERLQSAFAKSYPENKYTVVVEHVPPVPKWRWAFKVAGRSYPEVSEGWYSTEEELIKKLYGQELEWAQKLDKTERRD